MKIILSLFFLMTFSTAVAADTICRQPDTADFGPAVTAPAGNGFVIAHGCVEDDLVLQRPVSLSVLFGQGDRNSGEAVSKKPRSSWTVLFELDRADLADSNRLVLNRIPRTAKVRVTGYTCAIGSEDYNSSLSRKRAYAVAIYLRNRGVTVSAIQGKGECCPLSATDLSKNRRVFIEEE